MKKIKSFIYLLLLLPSLLFTSCLKDQEDYFDESSSARMTNMLDDARKVLMSSEKGWVFEVYPGEDQAYGGYVFTVKFDSLTCTAQSELTSNKSYSATSHYKMTSEAGASIIFDTYNELLHYFSEGTTSAYQAFGGDIEYVIDSVGTDVVKVHGARSLNTCYFRRLTTNATDYVTKAADMADNSIYGEFYGVIGDKQVAISMDLDNRSMTINPDTTNAVSELVTSAYVYTDKGLRFYKPINVNGVEITELNLDPSTGVLSADGVNVTGILPDGYRRYADYAGTYTLKYNDGKKSKTVKLVPNSDGSSYSMTGLFDSSDATVQVSYSKSTGALNICSQAVGVEGNYYVYMCAWDTSVGSLTWSESAGVQTVWNGDAENPVYTFKDNGQYSGLTINAFIMWYITSSGSSGGKYSGTTYLVNNSYQIPRLTSLVKQ